MISLSYVGELQCNGVAECFMRRALNRQPVWKGSTGLVPRARVPVLLPTPHLTSNRRDTMKIVVIGGTGLIGT